MMKINPRVALLVVGFALMLSYGAVKYWPKGIRNNNPGNIRDNPANAWKGKAGVDAQGFVIFEDASFGIRAMGKVFDSYRNRGVVTLSQMINAWAPAGDNNDVESYLSHVMQITGWQAAYMPHRSEGDYPTLVKAIIKHENGRVPYPDDYIAAALQIA